MVENGEILEQGSHNELIVAGGRYADLWSKQVFVRPSDATKESEGAAGGAGIVNDLSTEQTQTELSKVKPAPTKTEDKESAKPDDTESTKTEDKESTKIKGTVAAEDDGKEAIKGEDKDLGRELNGGKNGVGSTPKHKREVIYLHH